MFRKRTVDLINLATKPSKERDENVDQMERYPAKTPSSSMSSVPSSSSSNSNTFQSLTSDLLLANETNKIDKCPVVSPSPNETGKIDQCPIVSPIPDETGKIDQCAVVSPSPSSLLNLDVSNNVGLCVLFEVPMIEEQLSETIDLSLDDAPVIEVLGSDIFDIESLPVWTEENVIIENTAAEESHINLSLDEPLAIQQLQEEPAQPTIIPLTKKGTVRKRKIVEETMEERLEKKKLALKETHKVLVGCTSTCYLKCETKIKEDQRNVINEQFWEKSWIDRRSFVLNICERQEPKRKKNTPDFGSKKRLTFKYFLPDENGQKLQVCKTYFLTTLGFEKKNDRFIFEVLSKTPKNQLSPLSDKRGKKVPVNFIPKENIIEHILSFHPEVAHYRREHAPKRLYLPNDLNVSYMHNDFLNKYKDHKSVSYDVYRKEIKKMGISFAKLGHEECETCEEWKLHGHQEIEINCDVCSKWKSHKDAADEARAFYQKQKADLDAETLIVSGDMQKIIMLPRVDTFKKVVFTRRLIAYHESFVPVGNTQLSKPFAVIWHEAVSGRNKEDLISTFYAFLKHNRDVKHIIIWLDNCSSQNKNWCFYTFLVMVINSLEIASESITINYFEAGHTFMSADSFHHNVEQSLKKKGKVYDFQDFASAVKEARKDVDVKEMTIMDFYLWKDFTSQTKLTKDPDRTYMCDIVQVRYLILLRQTENLLCSSNCFSWCILNILLNFNKN